MSQVSVNPWTILSSNTPGGSGVINQPGRWVLSSASSYPIDISIAGGPITSYNQYDTITTNYTESFTFYDPNHVILKYQYLDPTCNDYFSTDVILRIHESVIDFTSSTINCTFKPNFRHPDTQTEGFVKGIIDTGFLGSKINIEAEWFREPGSGPECYVEGKCPSEPAAGFFTSTGVSQDGNIYIGYTNDISGSTMPDLELGDTIDLIRLRKSDGTNIDITIDNSSNSFDPNDPSDYADHVETEINGALSLLGYIAYTNFIPFQCIMLNTGKFEIFTIPKKTVATDWIGIDYNNARLDVNTTSYIGTNSGPYVVTGNDMYPNVQWTPSLDFSDVDCTSAPAVSFVDFDDSVKLPANQAILNGGVNVRYNDITFVESVNNSLEPVNYSYTCGLCYGEGILYNSELLPTGTTMNSWSWKLDNVEIGTDQTQPSFGPGTYTVTITNNAYSISCTSQPYEEI